MVIRNRRIRSGTFIYQFPPRIFDFIGIEIEHPLKSVTGTIRFCPECVHFKAILYVGCQLSSSLES